jgi:hypothetical protein
MESGPLPKKVKRFAGSKIANTFGPLRWSRAVGSLRGLLEKSEKMKINLTIAAAILLMLAATVGSAQQNATGGYESPVAPAIPAAQQPSDIPAAKPDPRVLVQAISTGNTWGAQRDQSIEMTKDFQRDCPHVIMTVNPSAADYTVSLRHIEVGFSRDNQIVVSNRIGDVLSTSEKGSIAADVKSACGMIISDWTADSVRLPGDAARRAFCDSLTLHLREIGSGYAQLAGTVLTVHSSRADEGHYESMLRSKMKGGGTIEEELRDRGFSKLIYTNDHNKNFTWLSPSASQAASAN